MNFKIKNISISGNIDFSVEIINPCNIYGAKINENCFIGPFCEIQNEVEIGSFTRIQSHTFVCSKSKIGRNCFIGHNVMFVNDKWSSGQRSFGDENKWGEIIIGDNVLIGTGSIILPCEICSNVTIGAGSLVNKKISKPGIYFGRPAKLYK